MARIARVILPGHPYHVVHWGNRGDDVFFTPADRQLYLDLLARFAEQYGMEVWAYCLMPNHVHLVVRGKKPNSLAKAIGRAHMLYSRHVNQTQGWTGHVWASRFFSTLLDDAHVGPAVKFVELNPVRSGLAARAEAYRWSSARVHAKGERDPLLTSQSPLAGKVKDWSGWLRQEPDEEAVERIRKATRTGRPTGSRQFVERLESVLGRSLTPQKRGRKPGQPKKGKKAADGRAAKRRGRPAKARKPAARTTAAGKARGAAKKPARKAAARKAVKKSAAKRGAARKAAQRPARPRAKSARK